MRKVSMDYTFIAVLIVITWSEQQDSNLRPPGPKPGALPNCAMPRQQELLYQ